MNLHVRKGLESDCSILFEWINDPITRKMSFSQKPVSFQEHEKWFQNILKDSDTWLLIIEQNENPIAQFRINKNNEVSFSIAPEYRGKKLSVPILKECITYVQRNSKRKNLIAFIKEQNTASIKTFEKSGFVFIEDSSYSNIPCLKYEYTL